jgi:Peroxidase
VGDPTPTHLRLVCFSASAQNHEMWWKESVLFAALILATSHGCPYISRGEHDTQRRPLASVEQPCHDMHQKLRRAQAAPPASLYDAIKEIIANVDGMLAKFVRLSFHDCVGGCDGCVDLSNPSNFGLDVPITALAPIVKQSADYLTTGDVWALAGLVSVKQSQVNTSFAFPLQFVGRPHCAGRSTKGPKRQLPSAHLTTKGVVDFFQTAFGFTPQQSVAILGAHTLYVVAR